MQVCERIIELGRALSRSQRSNSPLMYEWHDKKYLGAAHGLVGILHTLLVVCISYQLVTYLLFMAAKCKAIIFYRWFLKIRLHR